MISFVNEELQVKWCYFARLWRLSLRPAAAALLPSSHRGRPRAERSLPWWLCSCPCQLWAAAWEIWAETCPLRPQAALANTLIHPQHLIKPCTPPTQAAELILGVSGSVTDPDVALLVAFYPPPPDMWEQIESGSTDLNRSECCWKVLSSWALGFLHVRGGLGVLLEAAMFVSRISHKLLDQGPSVLVRQSQYPESFGRFSASTHSTMSEWLPCFCRTQSGSPGPGLRNTAVDKLSWK